MRLEFQGHFITTYCLRCGRVLRQKPRVVRCESCGVEFSGATHGDAIQEYRQWALQDLEVGGKAGDSENGF